MFCTRCGIDLPDDSHFCRKCGQALSGSQSIGAGTGISAAAAPRKAKRVRSSFVLGLIVVLLLLGWLANHAFQQDKSHSSPVSQFSLPPAPRLHTVKIGTGAVTVNANSYSYFTLAVPADATDVRMQGHFTAMGGSGNDIEVYVVSEDEFTNWKNGHSTPSFYNSGKVTVSDLNASLPNGAGTYYLVFNNKFSLLTPKAVQENVSLTYYAQR